MSQHLHHCPRCGGGLSPEGKQYICLYCKGTYEAEVAEEHTAALEAMLDAKKQEHVHNLRRVLYDAVNAKYISRDEVIHACDELRLYLPDDFAANFFKIAAGKDIRALNRAICAIDVNRHEDDIGGIVTFLTKSMSDDEDCLLSLNDLVERAYKKRNLPKLFDEYATRISRQAERVREGVYETAMPRDVFVAYSSKDMEAVIELVEALEEQGISCFVAARNLRHGVGSVENYDRALREAMDNCRSVVFVSSMNSRSFGCDALKIELAHVQARDIQNAPSEFRNDYASMPAKYKKPRVEYRIEESIRKNIGDTRSDVFFYGYERVYSVEGVLERVIDQLYALPEYPEVSPAPVEAVSVSPQATASTPADKPVEVSTAVPTAPKKAEPKMDVTVGKTVFFGTYEQDGFGAEPIEWLVLEKVKNRALLISKDILDCQHYHSTDADVTWESCSLRKWLNEAFYKAAFKAEEQAKILAPLLPNVNNPEKGTFGGNPTRDAVFLLSKEEIDKYLPSEMPRKAAPTVYARAMGSDVWWWFRTPGHTSKLVTFCYGDGSISLSGTQGYYVNRKGGGIRPAIWLKLD